MNAMVQTSGIRFCRREDMPAVAALFQRVFRKTDAAAPVSLAAALAEAHFDHPWFDPEIASRVHVNAEGRVTGFVGIVPGRFDYRGRTLRAAIAGSLMVEDPAREPLAGAKLMRAIVKGPQDFSISETTNPISQGLWQRLGGEVVPLLSLDWFRIFRPTAAALALLSEVAPRAALLGPAARLADRISNRWTRRYLQPEAPSIPVRANTEPSEASLVAALCDLSKEIGLHPRWSAPDLGWLLRHAARKERFGDFHRTLVYDAKDKLTGCYLYHGRPGGVGRVLNLLARPSAGEAVMDCLFREAAAAGLAALRGRTTPQLIDILLLKQCIFAHRGSTIVHTYDEDIRRAVASGDVLLTGLAGESWSRLIGGEFR